MISWSPSIFIFKKHVIVENVLTIDLFLTTQIYLLSLFITLIGHTNTMKLIYLLYSFLTGKKKYLLNITILTLSLYPKDG